MPIQHAVLAPARGRSDVRLRAQGTFEAAIGPQWGRLNIGHLYQTLDRLERDGYVTSERVAGDIRPDRRVYRAHRSRAGRARRAGWSSRPSATGGYRDELFFKLLVASRTGAPAVAGVVSRQRAYQLGELRTLSDLRRDARRRAAGAAAHRRGPAAQRGRPPAARPGRRRPRPLGRGQPVRPLPRRDRHGHSLKAGRLRELTSQPGPDRLAEALSGWRPLSPRDMGSADRLGYPLSQEDAADAAAKEVADRLLCGWWARGELNPHVLTDTRT